MRLKLDPQDGWLREIADIMSCEDSIIDQFLFFFFSQHVVTRVLSAVPLYHCTFFTPNWSLNDLTLNCLIATSGLCRSLFIKTFYFWIHCSLYWRSYKRKSIGTLFHQQFSLENPRYVLNGPFSLTTCSWG